MASLRIARLTGHSFYVTVNFAPRRRMPAWRGGGSIRQWSRSPDEFNLEQTTGRDSWVVCLFSFAASASPLR